MKYYQERIDKFHNSGIFKIGENPIELDVTFLTPLSQRQKNNLIGAGLTSIDAIIEAGIDEIKNINGFNKTNAEILFNKALEYSDA